MKIDFKYQLKCLKELFKALNEVIKNVLLLVLWLSLLYIVIKFLW